MEKYLFTIQNVEIGKLNALVNNIMKQTGADDPNEAIRLVNSGEWTLTVPARDWREADGSIYFSVTSDGTAGEEWIYRLRKKGFHVGNQAERLLISKNFKRTSGVTTEIAVLKDLSLIDGEGTIQNIRAEAKKRQLSKPNAEVACLVREKFSDEELKAMGLSWLVVMHEPINDIDGLPYLLNSHRRADGLWLDSGSGGPGVTLSCQCGFAFVVPLSTKKQNRKI